MASGSFYVNPIQLLGFYLLSRNRTPGYWHPVLGFTGLTAKNSEAHDASIKKLVLGRFVVAAWVKREAGRSVPRDPTQPALPPQR